MCAEPRSSAAWDVALGRHPGRYPPHGEARLALEMLDEMTGPGGWGHPGPAHQPGHPCGEDGSPALLVAGGWPPEANEPTDYRLENLLRDSSLCKQRAGVRP